MLFFALGHIGIAAVEDGRVQQDSLAAQTIKSWIGNARALYSVNMSTHVVLSSPARSEVSCYSSSVARGYRAIACCCHSLAFILVMVFELPVARLLSLSLRVRIVINLNDHSNDIIYLYDRLRSAS